MANCCVVISKSSLLLQKTKIQHASKDSQLAAVAILPSWFSLCKMNTHTHHQKNQSNIKVHTPYLRKLGFCNLTRYQTVSFQLQGLSLTVRGRREGDNNTPPSLSLSLLLLLLLLLPESHLWASPTLNFFLFCSQQWILTFFQCLQDSPHDDDDDDDDDDDEKPNRARDLQALKATATPKSKERKGIASSQQEKKRTLTLLCLLACLLGESSSSYSYHQRK